ncbi:hypothetical protein JOL79_07050 [Microbispora sp. RL4-1S]|uniref:Uncharacterized protein n=1 Tax=Microbispora oryzae TaxID=2806554 RepID=A0A941AH07_9ACTN|nr:hypothetical protein [Microbispora oryzae]MBP2703556.1 hypothetical protein [Microbispora oryzae]
MIPLDRELARCEWPDGGCGRKILWTVTASGKRQPLDARPDAERGSVAAYRVDARVWSSRSLLGAGALGPAPHEHVYRPHAETCPRLHQPQPPAAAPAAAPAGPAEIPGLLPDAQVLDLREARARRGRGRSAQRT